MTDQDLRPPRRQGMQPGNRWALWLVLLLALAGGGWYAWQRYQAQHAAAPQTPLAAAPAPQQPEPEPAPGPAAPEEATAPPEPAAPEGPLHPIEAQADAAHATEAVDAANAQAETGAVAVAPTLDGPAFEQAVSDGLGRVQVLKFVALQGLLAHHIVATIDNLPRSHAAPRLWPLYPVGGRMAVLQDADGSLQMAPDNSARYDAVVGFVAGVDMAQAVAVYRRFYPVLQQAYEDLGYPGQYFNDRLVEVIDHLLQAPEPQGPLSLRLVQVQSPEGPVPPQQPWLRYELADAQLQSLSAGQKILVRLGPAHAQTVKAQLRILRSHIAVGR